MKKTIVSMTALVMAFLLVFALPASFAAAENTQETAAQATEAPTEKPKVSAAELQNQGILTVGAKGEDVKRLQQRLKDLGYLDGKVDGQYGGGTKRAVIAFQLITLPVEFNASGRALRTLSGGGFLTVEEQKGVRKVLSAAAMTYVVALVNSLLHLIRLLAIRNRRR